MPRSRLHRASLVRWLSCLLTALLGISASAPARAQGVCASSVFGSLVPAVGEAEIYTAVVESPANGAGLLRTIFDGPDDNDGTWSAEEPFSPLASGLDPLDFALVAADLGLDGTDDLVSVHPHPTTGALVIDARSSLGGASDQLVLSSLCPGCPAVAASNVAATRYDWAHGSNGDTVAVAFLDTASQRLWLALVGPGSTRQLLQTPLGYWGPGSVDANTILDDNDNQRNLSIDSGDLDGDGVDEIVVAYRPTTNQVRLAIFAADGSSQPLSDLARMTLPADSFSHVVVRVGDIDGALRGGVFAEEIVLLYDDRGTGLPAEELVLRALQADIDAANPTLGDGAACLDNDATFNGICVTVSDTVRLPRTANSVDMALADVDRDSVEELVLAWGSPSNTWAELWAAEAFFAPGAPISQLSSWNDDGQSAGAGMRFGTYQDPARQISLVATDVDLSGLAQILVAYRDDDTGDIETLGSAPGRATCSSGSSPPTTRTAALSCRSSWRMRCGPCWQPAITTTTRWSPSTSPSSRAARPASRSSSPTSPRWPTRRPSGAA